MKTQRLLVLLIFVSCVTVDEEGKRIEFTSSYSQKEWSIHEISVGPRWLDREKEIPLLILSRDVNLPVEYVLKDLPDVRDQGRQASSTAFAVGYLTMSYHMQRKGHKQYICSPSFVYNLLNNGKDEGIEVIDALYLLKDTGCPSETLFPYIEYDYRIQPTPEVINSASSYRIKGFARIDPTDVFQIATLIYQNNILIATIFITENFLNLKEKEYTPKGRLIGKHTIGVVGYNLEKRKYIAQNSAGKKWGDNGYFWISHLWFERLVVSSYAILDQN
ncbi:MAG: C1 family peptidase [Leptospiraceae bacterium]|nr:C1 family peptidase [Leptospiraceae bacterium]MDW7976231.1 C1 family peptidase [Leptospiraceae bacterium]